jgi:hypothetical protein
MPMTIPISSIFGTRSVSLSVDELLNRRQRFRIEATGLKPAARIPMITLLRRFHFFQSFDQENLIIPTKAGLVNVFAVCAQHPVCVFADFDPEDPAGVIPGLFDNSQLLGKPHKLDEPVDLVYGPGTDPYVNIVDDKDIPIPGFGQLEVPLTSP